MAIYLDHAATTPTDREVLAEMLPYFSEVYGNASSQHAFGREAMKALDKARLRVARAIGAKESEIYFTSGGTESDNWALKGMAAARSAKGRHIISSVIEHPAVLRSLESLEAEGYEITYLPVDSEGRVSPAELERVIREDTILVSVMTANNEIGTIQPIAELAAICHAHGVPFHTDAVQAIGAVRIDVKAMGIDLLSMSAHKFYGPKGIGVLYLRNGLKLGRYMSGGEQERGMRSGTSATPLIVGMGCAIEKAYTDFDEVNDRERALRDMFIERVLSEIPYTRLNGSRTERLANNISLSFEFIEGESLLLHLDLAGIAASSGSACSSGSLEPSHVLAAIGVPIEKSHGTLRFSLGRSTTEKEIDYVIDVLQQKVALLREMSPLFAEFRAGGYNV